MGNDGEVNEAKQIVALCRAGRLYELEKWIADGKSLDISGATKRRRQGTLLQIAVETGFHSLVELIAKHDSQSSKNAALAEATRARRLDLVELLAANGAEIKSLSLVDALLSWEPKLIRYFLDHGADPVEDRPFTTAFVAKVRTALRPFVEYRQAHPDLAPQLQEQLDCALRFFCAEGDLKWVSLLLWAGANPRSRGPCPEKEYTEDPECYTSALEEACCSENLDVLKRLKPCLSDDMSELLQRAAIWCRRETLAYLLDIGADPNDKPNGGSSVLDVVLTQLGFAHLAYGSKRLKSKYDVARQLECVHELLSRGAIWNLSDAPEMNALRRTLLECEPDVTIELLQLLRKHNACPAERVHKLLATPRMKQHLNPAMNALLRLGIHLDMRANAGPKAQRGRAQISR